ncbi:hypothetical protein K474DRAFT_1568082, partial [Panus rudis PR-1116 ss-1]
VIDQIFQLLPPDTILHLQLLSKTVQHVVLDYIQRAWDLGSLLQPFFSNVVSFRRILHETQAVVSGSQPIQFFSRSHYDDSDLDIYVQIEGALALGQWLQRHHYMYRPHDSSSLTFYEAFLRMAVARSKPTFLTAQEGYDDVPITAVFNFHKTQTGSERHRSQLVQIIVVSEPPLQCILQFHSSTSH